MVLILSVHESGMKPIASGSNIINTAPPKNFFCPLNHKNNAIASTAKNAPRDWLPKMAMALSPMVARSKIFSHLDETTERRKYISGMVMTKATAIALLSDMKPAPGGP